MTTASERGATAARAVLAELDTTLGTGLGDALGPQAFRGAEGWRRGVAIAAKVLAATRWLSTCVAAHRELLARHLAGSAPVS